MAIILFLNLKIDYLKNDYIECIKGFGLFSSTVN